MNTRATIGVKDLVYAVQLTDPANGTPTYGTVYSLEGVRNLSFATNSSITRLFADDKQFAASATNGEMTLSMEVVDVPFDHQARMLGITYTNGQLVEGADDASPYLAIGGKISLEAGVYRYFWLPKVLLSKPGTDAATKESSVSYQTPTLEGAVMNLISNGNYRHNIRTDDANVPATMLANYFDQPVFALDADLGALAVAIAEGTGGNAGKIELTFSKTGGGNFTLDADSVSTAEIIIAMGTGIEAGTLSTPSGTPASSQVIYFTPTSAFSSTDQVGVSVIGVRDNNGVVVTTNADVIEIA